MECRKLISMSKSFTIDNYLTGIRMNGELFEWYVQNQLRPTLSPGQVVIRK